ncbi:DUF6361 family protein [Dactylosporangium siamense]|uniref:Uncharacterized protein n=1 Tax=Dactylosporangium siamense TaxID=685454 RepID=A0A919PP28_9ACTN|nr:DUF6361 family protein [Dactylosporangium siamense]GIG46731.1 hypothetical protein Dsi01nite_047720 [Dactylosporangium siamense]
MASALSWLDSSRADQQRMRELLNLFSNTESRDELGIGQVRDAFSDMLFPGISTLHTRARYLLIVPWCFQDAQGRRLRGNATSARVSRNERTVISALIRAGRPEGMVGRYTGVKVRTLPSTIYATALTTFGIRTGEEPVTRSAAETEELAELRTGMWHPTLPDPPAGFPTELDGELTLGPDEARWLRECMLARVPNTLLAHLLAPERWPALEADHPWDDAVTAGASPEITRAALHAGRFSLAIHGAALLYNLLVAERYEAAGLIKHAAPVDLYRALLADWAVELAGLSAWNRAEMWSQVIEVNPRIATNLTARRFIDLWLDAVATGGIREVRKEQSLRTLIGERERSVKKSQSRLTNEKLLRNWSGASGSARLVYRWPQARSMLMDIHNGCAAESEVELAGA